VNQAEGGIGEAMSVRTSGEVRAMSDGEVLQATDAIYADAAGADAA
jgi:hypothetical protein